MKIETPRLYLRPYRESDVTDALGLWGDPETMSFYPQPFSRDQVEVIIGRNIETYRRFRRGLFTVIEKESGAFIGNLN